MNVQVSKLGFFLHECTVKEMLIPKTLGISKKTVGTHEMLAKSIK